METKGNYKCKYCNTEYKSKSGLKKHKKTKKHLENEKDYNNTTKELKKKIGGIVLVDIELNDFCILCNFFKKDAGKEIDAYYLKKNKVGYIIFKTPTTKEIKANSYLLIGKKVLEILESCGFEPMLIVGTNNKTFNDNEKYELNIFLGNGFFVYGEIHDKNDLVECDIIHEKN